LALTACIAANVWAQTSAVSTIKPSSPDEGYSVAVQGRRFVTRQTSLKELIGYAYMMNVRQIVGGPGWIESDRFDVEAETDREEKLSQPVARAMVQQLLADRFHLVMHPDRKELAVYAVTAGSETPKLTKSAGNSQGFGTIGIQAFGQMSVVNATMGEFANLLQRYVLDRPVLDQTGIEGRYDLKLQWTADDSQFNGRGGQMPKLQSSFEPPDIFGAFREQLGLRLVAKRDLAPVVVVDRVERPGEN
jgi:uncharacterized protein (TIGR03435 family)